VYDSGGSRKVRAAYVAWSSNEIVDWQSELRQRSNITIQNCGSAGSQLAEDGGGIRSGVEGYKGLYIGNFLLPQLLHHDRGVVLLSSRQVGALIVLQRQQLAALILGLGVEC
jgi:hypothetical protein